MLTGSFLRFILIILTIAGIAAPSFAQKKYILLLSGGKVGINLDNGTRVLPPRFDKLGWSDGKFEIVNGLTGFQNGGAWGIVSMKGDIIVPASFHTLVYKGSGLLEATVTPENGSLKSGCIDLTGKTIIPFEYDEVRIIGNRIIIGKNEGGDTRYGVTDIQLRSLIPRTWRSVSVVNDQYFLVENDLGQKAVFDFDGNRKTTFPTDSVRLMSNSEMVFFQGPMAGVIESNKSEPQNAVYKSIKVSKAGKTEVLRFHNWILLNADNKIIDKIEADSIRLLPDGALRIYRNGFIAIVSPDFNEPAISDFKPSGKITGKVEVKKDKKGKGLADENGTWLVRPEYEEISWNGLVAVAVRNYEDGTTETRFIRPLTDGWISPAYESVKITGGFFNVRKYGRHGINDLNGNEIIPAVYDSVISIKGNTIHVGYLGKFGLMDFDQKWIELPQTGRITLADEQNYLIHLPNNNRLKNIEGKVIYTSPYPLEINNKGEIEEHIPGGIKKCLLPDGRPCTGNTNSSGFKASNEKITIKENVVTIPASVPLDFPETEGLKGFFDNGKFGFRDSRNRIRIANRYDSIRPFREGKAAIKLIGKWGFINSEDRIVIQPLYSQTTDFSNGISRIKKDGKWGMINDQGQVVLNPVYDRITHLEGTEKFIITADSLFGLVSGTGQLLIEPKYQYLEPVATDRFLVKREYYGIVNSEGEPIFPMNYTHLYFIRKRNAFLTEEKTGWVELSRD